MSHTKIDDPDSGKAAVAGELVTDPGTGKITGIQLGEGEIRVTEEGFSLRRVRVDGQLGPTTLKFTSVEAARRTYRFKHERAKMLRGEEERLRRLAHTAREDLKEADTELRLTTEALLSIEAGETTHLYKDPQ